MYMEKCMLLWSANPLPHSQKKNKINVKKYVGISKESFELGADRVYLYATVHTIMYTGKDKQTIVFLMYVPHFSLLVV